jgi:hypothetical protein
MVDWHFVVKKAWLGLLIAIFFVAIMIAVKAEPINMSCGTNYSYNYTDILNTSIIQLFNCKADNYSCTNTTIIVNGSINVSYFNISMIPGDLIHQNTSYCDVTTSCASNTSSVNGTCSITRGLIGGESYDNTASGCDIHFFCSAPNASDVNNCDYECLNEEQTITKKVRIYSDGGRVKFVLDGQEQLFLLNGTFDYSANIDYTCPANLLVDVTNESAQLLDLCSKINPYLVNWVDAALMRGAKFQDQYTGCVEDKTSATLNCDDRVKSYEEAVMLANVQVNGTMMSYQRCLDDKAVIESKHYYLVAFIVILSIFSGMLLIATIILATALWKSKHDNTPGVQGSGGDF